MPRRYAIAVGVVLSVLLGINLWLSEHQALQRSATSFGVGPDGYKAAYDLLVELGVPATRSYLPASQIPRDRPLWLVAPAFLDADQHDADAKRDAGDLLKWVRLGGTAVVFGDAGSAWRTLDLTRDTSGSGQKSVITGDFARVPREIAVPKLQYFSAGAGRARVVLRSAQGPFALEMPLGAGRLVAIADSSFMLNNNLARSSSSLLVFDLVRALGVPAFDERCHGLAPPFSLPAIIARSRAIVPLGLGLVAALLWIGEQRRWPRRTLVDPPKGPQPSIGSFIESLGVLYSATRDPQAVFRAYRAGFLGRVGRQLSPRAELPQDRVINRLARDRSLSPETRQWLVEGAAPRDERELVSAIRAIESCPKMG
jgi:uncharacterized protein DUF4350